MISAGPHRHHASPDGPSGPVAPLLHDAAQELRKCCRWIPLQRVSSVKIQTQTSASFMTVARHLCIRIITGNFEERKAPRIATIMYCSGALHNLTTPTSRKPASHHKNVCELLSKSTRHRLHCRQTKLLEFARPPWRMAEKFGDRSTANSLDIMLRRCCIMIVLHDYLLTAKEPGR